MSSAFVREQDGPDLTEDLPDRPVSPHPNLVTSEGLAAIVAEVEQARAALAAAREAEDREAGARALRDLRYWQHRHSTAETMPPPPDRETVHFGSTVTILRDDGRRIRYRIVGEDEADPARGTLSWVSPLARAMLGQGVGTVVEAGQHEAEIVAIG